MGTGTSQGITTGVDAGACAQRRLPANPEILQSKESTAWDAYLARVVSNVGSPPVMATGAMTAVAARLSTTTAWTWAIMMVGLSVLVPLCYVLWRVKRGDITDLDVSSRKQRVQPLLITMTSTELVLLALLAGEAPPTMIVLAGTMWLQVILLFAITLRWKISVHTATAAGATTIVWALLGTPVPLLVIVPLVGWSRVRLRRHSLLQTGAGALLGLALFSAAAAIMSLG